MRSKVVLVTDGFPFGMNETFLESELPFLSEFFNEVHIVAVTDEAGSEQRAVPANCKIHAVDIRLSKFEKAFALRHTFHPLLKEEKEHVKNNGRMTFNSAIRNTMLVSLARAIKIKAFIESLVLDVEQSVYYSYWCNDAALALALMKDENPGLKAVSRIHGWDLYFEASEIGYLPYRPFIAKSLDAILPISDKGREYIHEFWGIDERYFDKVTTYRLGVDAGLNLTQKSDGFHVVTCSNIIPLKRLDLFVEALAALPENICLNWTHFGSGKLMEDIQKQAATLSSNISVDFKGRVPNNEVLQWYADNKPSLFVNVSSTEGVPVSVMEAQSFGIPVIATDVGGTGEIVNDDIGALITANPSASEIAEKLLQFYHLDDRSFDALVVKVRAQWELLSNAETNYTKFAGFLRE